MAKSRIEQQIEEVSAQMNRRTAEIQEQAVAAQEQQRKGGLFSNFFDLMIVISKAICKLFGIQTSADRDAQNQALQRQKDAVFQQKEAAKEAGSSDMKASLENVLKAVLGGKAAEKHLMVALEDLGAASENTDHWAFDYREEKDGTTSVMFKESASKNWRPFLEGIPTIEDAEKAVHKIPIQELDKISRAGRILEYVAAAQGQDGVRMRKRFTSAATFSAMNKEDWTGKDFAKAFIPYLKGDGPPKPKGYVPPSPPRDKHSKSSKIPAGPVPKFSPEAAAAVVDECPVPPAPNNVSFEFAPEPKAPDGALVAKMMKMGIVADEPEEELELATTGPRM